ncbi:phosphotransferase family protein [Erythrobacter neustonensis]|uniref:Tyrosine protein kinase n=1 Tax=Erythrobacter neustonensis TaxID=1112 RepID=A0A192D3I2_9SPHN|nr:phosphotransferase family protein [Erythrobacter neustonensis]ANK12561.1 tyrosine protein kinase [Erythrobacter neustonensis]
MTADELGAGLARVCARVGLGALSYPPQRLTGGAVMESWRFAAGGCDYVLRRAPSAAFMEGRPYGHSVEAALIEAARAKGVTAPEVVAVLEEADGLGSGFIMRALPGTADPKVILACDDPEGLLRGIARDLARIHRLRQGDVPEGVPVMDYRAAIADLKQQFMEAGGDRPIIALGLRWLEDNCPPEAEPVLNHGDYRMGNLLVEGPRLTGVLDWELAHFGDRHEDLAFGCMAVWRFARYDRPALGLGSIADYLAAYEAEASVAIDPLRFRFWTIYRTVWWALGCLKMAAQWRSGADRMLERVVISRRTSEQELDLLLLLEEDAPEMERRKYADPMLEMHLGCGEATNGNIATAISEWLETIKPHLSGHDRFQLAVACNALGMIARDDAIRPQGIVERPEAQAILAGKHTLASPGLLRHLRATAIEKLSADVPKYPALSAARKKWTGEN